MEPEKENNNASEVHSKCPAFKDHFSQHGHLYELLLLALTFFTGMIMAIWSIRVAMQALESQMVQAQLQDKEFRLRNRPYLILAGAEFSGAARRLDGFHTEHSVVFRIENLADIPALELKFRMIGISTASHGKLPQYLLTTNAAACFKDKPVTIACPIHEGVLSDALRGGMEVALEIEYIGILENGPTYKTVANLNYLSKTTNFSVSVLKFTTVSDSR